MTEWVHRSVFPNDGLLDLAMDEPSILSKLHKGMPTLKKIFVVYGEERKEMNVPEIVCEETAAIRFQLNMLEALNCDEFIAMLIDGELVGPLLPLERVLTVFASSNAVTITASDPEICAVDTVGTDAAAGT